ncbi:MAG: hypothetical protein ACRD0D_12465 [Acidimicrobiales bacterium]
MTEVRESLYVHMSRKVLAVVGTVSLVGGSLALATVAGALGSSGFEGADGDLVAGSGTDWANVVVSTATDETNSSSDTSYTGGAKEDDPGPNVAAGSIPPNKDDLARAYAASEQAGGHEFLYLALGPNRRQRRRAGGLRAEPVRGRRGQRGQPGPHPGRPPHHL